MDRGCQLIQEVLIEVEGETSRLSEAELRHLDSCASCRALAGAERRLVELLATAVPPADRTLEVAVMRAVRARDRRRFHELQFPNGGGKRCGGRPSAGAA